MNIRDIESTVSTPHVSANTLRRMVSQRVREAVESADSDAESRESASRALPGREPRFSGEALRSMTGMDTMQSLRIRPADDSGAETAHYSLRNIFTMGTTRPTINLRG